MNKKGQVLVMFVLLLPILFLGIYFIYLKIDLHLEKENQKRIFNKICKYYQKDKEIDDILEIIEKEDNTQEILIDKEYKSIKVTILKEKELFLKTNKIETIDTCKKG